MTISVYSQFLSHFKNGVMKPNRYEVEFNLPQGVSGTAIDLSKRDVREANIRKIENSLNGVGGINIKCHTAMYPQRSLSTTERLQNSAPFRTPYSSNYDPITFSFYADGTGDTRRYFDLWQNTVINVKTNTLNFYDEYVSDLRIWTLNEAGVRTYGVVCREAYPLAIGAVDISYSNQNNFQNIVATFTYRRWEELNTVGVVSVGLPQTV